MRRTILLADDSVTIRKIVELTFSDTDIRVESVASGREALERIGELHPDLVLADVVMPGPSGYEICRTIKQSSRPVPVLLLAGTFEPFDAREARDCGSDGHVTKPFDSRVLVERVEQLLAHGAPAMPTGAAAARVDADDLESMFDDLAAPAIALAESPIALQDDPAPPDAGTVEPRQEALSLTSADIDAIAARVIERLSERVVREIAWDVVPDLAEIVVRERLKELERDSS